MALENIKEFHRNPIAHPGEQINSAEECLELVAALRAAMGYMLEALPMDFTPASLLPDPFAQPGDEVQPAISWDSNIIATDKETP